VSLRDEAILSKYCPSDTSLTIVKDPIADFDNGTGKYLDKFQAANVLTINKGSNQKQYCGFKDKAAREAENSGTAGTTTEGTGSTTTKLVRPKFAVLTTRCDDFKGINAAYDDYPTPATLVAGQRSQQWDNEYCQARDDARTQTKRVGGVSNYCGSDIDWAKPSSYAAMNKDTWKGEYCFDDFKVGKCYGGQIPATGSVSTDPDDKRCSPF